MVCEGARTTTRIALIKRHTRLQQMIPGLYLGNHTCQMVAVVDIDIAGLRCAMRDVAGELWCSIASSGGLVLDKFVEILYIYSVSP
jgi:hypothetical protein